MTLIIPPANKVAGQAGFIPDINNLYSAVAQMAASLVLPSADTSGATDFAAITNALANTNVAVLYPGTFYTNQAITIGSQQVIRGAGHEVSIIQLANASNCPMITTSGFASLTGTGSNSGGAGEFQLQGFTLDGNQAGQSSPAAAAVQIYGYDFLIDDVDIVHCLATDGLWTEFGSGGLPGPEGADEARYRHMRIMNNTFTGAAWRDRGPHDSHGYSIFIAFNTAGGPPWGCTGYLAQFSSGIYTTGNSLRAQMHVYGNHGNAYDLQGSVRFVNCIAEGASGSQLLIEAGDCSWTGGNIFPGGAAGGAGITLGTIANAATGFTIVGTEVQNFAGTSAATAAINLVNTSTGKIDVTCYQPTGTAVWGTGTGVQVDARVAYLQTNVPSVAAGAALGTSPPAPTVSNASDLRATVNMGTGTATAAGTAATVTFAQPKVAASPAIAVWPLNAATALLSPYVVSTSQTALAIGFATAPAASQAAGTYKVGFAQAAG